MRDEVIEAENWDASAFFSYFYNFVDEVYRILELDINPIKMTLESSQMGICLRWDEIPTDRDQSFNLINGLREASLNAIIQRMNADPFDATTASKVYDLINNHFISLIEIIGFNKLRDTFIAKFGSNSGRFSSDVEMGLPENLTQMLASAKSHDAFTVEMTTLESNNPEYVGVQSNKLSIWNTANLDKFLLNKAREKLENLIDEHSFYENDDLVLLIESLRNGTISILSLSPLANKSTDDLDPDNNIDELKERLSNVFNGFEWDYSPMALIFDEIRSTFQDLSHNEVLDLLKTILNIDLIEDKLIIHFEEIVKHAQISLINTHFDIRQNGITPYTSYTFSLPDKDLVSADLSGQSAKEDWQCNFSLAFMFINLLCSAGRELVIG